MPIGLLIGWLIGQFLGGIFTVLANSNPQTVHADVCAWIGRVMAITALCALIGTFIELYV